MRICAIVPTRGDRKILFDRAMFYLDRQTVQVDKIIVDYPPEGEVNDVTARYHNGIDWAIAENYDVAFLIEDDDWYAPDYIEKMIAAWISKGQPNLFGIGETVYYHIAVNKYRRIPHITRSSAMSTMVKPKVLEGFKWPTTERPFFDVILWNHVNSKNAATIVFDKPINVGIKHGLGATAGVGHRRDWREYQKGNDPNWVWLAAVIDEDSLNFYKNLKLLVNK